MNVLKRISRTQGRAGSRRLPFGVAISASCSARTAPSWSRRTPTSASGPLMPVIARHVAWAALHGPISPSARRIAPRASSRARGDGELNAIALRHLGDRRHPRLGRPRPQLREKGGVAALRGPAAGAGRGRDGGAHRRRAQDRARLREGIVTLAQLSGRPIVPVAVVTSRRIDFTSWDRASLGLPFGRGAIVLGEPVHVARGGRRRAPSRRRGAPSSVELDRGARARLRARRHARPRRAGADPGASQARRAGMTSRLPLTLPSTGAA